MSKEKAFFVSYFWQDMDGKQGYGWCDITTDKPIIVNALHELVEKMKDKYKFEKVTLISFQEIAQPDEATVIANVCKRIYSKCAGIFNRG